MQHCALIYNLHQPSEEANPLSVATSPEIQTAIFSKLSRKAINST